MKYTRLTKEQFEELHQEFANFLASQNIDKTEWEQIKAEKPETVILFGIIFYQTPMSDL